MQYAYPEYHIDFTPALIAECRACGQRLLEEVGMSVAHEKFLAGIRGKPGVRVEGDRVFLSRSLTDRYIEEFIAEKREALLAPAPAASPPEWSLACGGFSIMVLDIDTDEARPATQQDLRDLIRLVHAFDMGGNYPVAPQDLPPLMRALACFKICWQESDRIRPFDYLDQVQTPFLYDMYQVMDKPFVININLTDTMAVSHIDIDIFMRFYPHWKRNPDSVAWYHICDYAMTGVSKPITATGTVALYIAHLFGTYILFNLFDPEVKMPFGISAGMPVDLNNMGWAFGSPRGHLYAYLTARVLPALCGVDPGLYRRAGVNMDSNSCAVDERAGMEKMASTLTAAFQGVRQFSGAGNLAIDDLFSGVQFVMDVEIFEYVRELVESFDPHPDIFSTEGMYEVLHDVATGREQFYTHPDTARRVRNIFPISKRRTYRKLRAWMTDKENLIDRARAECKERIRGQEPFVLEEDKHRELDRIYNAAEKALLG